MRLRFRILMTLLLLTLSNFVRAQEFGLSFSYFIPKNGYFSTPISPFSIRGLGVDLNRFLALETGASLYRMSGLNMKDLPFESREPLVGPNFTIFVPVELVIQFHGQQAEFDIKGGVFGFYGFDQKINYGNFDRAFKAYQGWEVANGNLTFENSPGWGYHGGAELLVYVTPSMGISLEANYLVGGSKFPLRGTYTGGNATNETITLGDEYQQAMIDFTGLEVSIGLVFSQGGGGPAPKSKYKKKRR